MNTATNYFWCHLVFISDAPAIRWPQALHFPRWRTRRCCCMTRGSGTGSVLSSSVWRNVLRPKRIPGAEDTGLGLSGPREGSENALTTRTY